MKKTLEDAYDENILPDCVTLNGKKYYRESYVNDITQTAKNRITIIKRIRELLDDPISYLKSQQNIYKLIWKSALLEASRIGSEHMFPAYYFEDINKLINLSDEDFKKVMEQIGVSNKHE